MQSTEQNDPNVRIPAAVRAAGKRAEAKFKEAYPAATPAADPAEPATPTTEAAPTPPTAETPPTQPPITTEVTPATEPPPPAAPAPDADNFEHKYNSMKGRYEREAERTRALSDQLLALQGTVADLTTKVNARPAPPVPVQLPPEDQLTPAEESEYGAEFLSVVGKKAKQMVTAEVSGLHQTIADLQAKLAGTEAVVVQDARQRLFSDLDREISNWRELNDDQNFVAWLQLPDPYSGAIRHQLLKQAYEQNNAPRVLAFFKGFLATEAASDPANSGFTPKPAVTEQAPAPGSKVNLADLAAPGRAKSPAATPAPAEKPIIHRAQITQFYLDCSTGKYAGREDERKRLEKMIFEAQAEGRIR